MRTDQGRSPALAAGSRTRLHPIIQLFMAPPAPQGISLARWPTDGLLFRLGVFVEGDDDMSEPPAGRATSPGRSVRGPRNRPGAEEGALTR